MADLDLTPAIEAASAWLAEHFRLPEETPNEREGRRRTAEGIITAAIPALRAALGDLVDDLADDLPDMELEDRWDARAGVFLAARIVRGGAS